MIEAKEKWMKIYKYLSRPCRRKSVFMAILILIQAQLSTFAYAINDKNVYFHGALVAEPCVIKPGDEDIKLDFGTIIDKYLYLNERTFGQVFKIHLTECDLSLGNLVKVRFIGSESLAMKGFLSINPGSQAKGIGIGLETLESEQLFINESSSKHLLKEGENIIILKAFVQGEKKAIKDKTIGYGDFNSVATFSMEYE